MTKVKDMPNMYEADFKQFFHSVSIPALMNILKEELKLPKGEIAFLYQINIQQPKLEQETKLEEFHTKQFNYIT